MQPKRPLTHDLVLIGGGHAHALVLAKAAMRPIPGARLTMVNPEPTAPYTGMLPGLAAGHYAREEIEIDLMKLADSAGARLVIGQATGLDRRERLIHVAGRADISYDVASLDIGTTTRMDELPGYVEHAVPAKPLSRFAASWERFLKASVEGDEEVSVVVIGGGVAGVEIAMAMAWRLRALQTAQAAVTVVEASNRVLGEVRPRTRRLLLRRLKDLGVSIQCLTQVAAINDGHVVLTNGDMIRCSFVAGAAGARPHDWLRDTGLKLRDGFVVVDRHLRSESDPRIYACGDCAHFEHAPLAKAGVYAVRQGPVLWHNFCGELTSGGLKAFRPQRDFLKLVSTGKKHAVAEKFGLSWAGEWVWRYKDYLDRKFMDRCTPKPLTLPAHAQGDTEGVKPAPEMLCGGCGSKAGSATVQSALASYAAPRRNDVVEGIGDDAAVLSANGSLQVISTDNLRLFTSDFWMHGRIAAVHALGDIWAMGADPQAALVSIVLPQMPERMAANTVREITEAAAEVFSAEGAEIVGGHTCFGTDMMVGFTVTGLASEKVATKAGALPGDRLILTKAIGSGTLLAGRLAGAARGRDIVSAEFEMMRTSGRAARMLAPVANAMTDVSGYGLAGHLLEILERSDAAARIQIDRVPTLSGAAELAAAGIRSVIWEDNARVAARMTVAEGCSTLLLFDPQTSGGLLACVPPADCGDAVRTLNDAGCHAAEIGEIIAGRPWITVG